VVNKFGRKFGRKYRQMYPFPANLPVVNVLKTNVRLPFPLHGMEEVVGSIPTRSTKSLNKLVKARTSLTAIADCLIRVM
jgi:hypothetical protein